jgi:ribonuclease III
LLGLFLNRKDASFKALLVPILGYQPRKLLLYKMALTHSSLAEKVESNNERLEFLGDAVLSSVVGHYLFSKYPYKTEGFLTEMRSKMVNRTALNEIGLRVGLDKITLYNKSDNTLKKSQIFGNALEALIGAIFLEKGYNKTRDWVHVHIIEPYLDVDELESIEINFKNKLFSWASKNGKVLTFDLVEEANEKGRKLFTMGVFLDGVLLSSAKAFNKKDASQLAAQDALLQVELLGQEPSSEEA